VSLKPFDVFICHKKSSGNDFAKHLKKGLEELGIHAFYDSEDIPQKVDGIQEWTTVRDRAIQESKVFILLITPGFDLSPEVKKELSLARKNFKQFVFFRQRDLRRKIVVDLGEEKVDLGKQQQVSFETKEELLRLAHRILLKNQENSPVTNQPISNIAIERKLNDVQIAAGETGGLRCVACSKLIKGQPHIETIGGKKYNFDSAECARVYRKLRSIYGKSIE
jgi:hypothetical protein